MAGTNQRCGANKTDGSGTCRHVAGYGTDHVGSGYCKFHNGSTRAGKRHAARELIARGPGWYGDAEEVDPDSALLVEVRRTAGHVSWLEKYIAYNQDFEDANALLLSSARELYKEERKHLVQVCSAAIGAGIAERQVQIAERLGAQLATLLDGILSELNLTKDQRKRAPDVVRRHLTLVTEAA